jgi:hypothetical protein
MASGDEISNMRHQLNRDDEDLISSKHSKKGVLIPGMTSNFGGVESLNSTIQVSQMMSKRGDMNEHHNSPNYS